MSFILRQIIENNTDSPPIVIHITDSEVCIGRKFKVSLEKFAQISRHHATVFQSDNNLLFIKDEGSLNGTYVNGEKLGVKKLKTLCVGDRIGFGIPCDNPSIGLVCIVCCDEPPYKVKDEVIVISDNEDEVQADSCLEQVNVESSEDEVNVVNNNNDVNNLDFKIVNITSRAKVPFATNDPPRIVPPVDLQTKNANSFPSAFATKTKVPFSSNDPSRISPPVDLQTKNDSSFPSPFATKARKSFVYGGSNTAAETHTTKTLKTLSCSKDATATTTESSSNSLNVRSCVNRSSIDNEISKSVKPKNSNSETVAIRNIKVEDVSNSTSTFSNCTINASSKNSYEDKASSLTADRKLLGNNNVADSFTTKKLKTVGTTNLDSLSTEVSINSHLSTNESNSRTHKTSFYHKNSIEISPPKTVNSRNVSNALFVNVKDSIAASNQKAESSTVIHKTATPCSKHIEATKSVETTSLTSVPHSSKHNYKRKSSIENLPRKECSVNLAGLSTKASINSHPSTNESSSRTHKTSFYHKNSIEISPPKTVNSRNVSNALFVNAKDSIAASNQTAETTSLTSVPYSSKHNYKRKSSIENLPRKECTIKLVKCDSDTFKFPPDIKNPFLKKHNHVHKASVHKHVKKQTQNSKYGIPNIEKRKSSVDDKVLDTYPSKKVCLTSKKNENEFSVTRHKKQRHYNVASESDSDNNEVTYSQVEEVIDITDDNIYLDFQSSQNFVYIKKEPGEIQDELNEEIYAEIFENDNEYDNLDNKASKLNVDDSFVESIESIKAFVGCYEKEQKELENNVADDNNYLENSFFPVLSQGFESEEEDDINNSKSCSKKSNPEAQDSSEEEVYFKEEPSKKKKDKEYSKILSQGFESEEEDDINNSKSCSKKSNPEAQDSSEEEVYFKEEPSKKKKDKEYSKIKLTDLPKPLLGQQGHKKRRDKKNNSNDKSKSYSKKVPTRTDAQNSSEEEIYYIVDELKITKDKDISKINQKEEKLSKIKLCEPKPLSYRPKYKKGRDENFVEKSKSLSISKSSKKNPKNFEKPPPTKENNINTQSNFNNFKIPLKRALPKSDQSENQPHTDNSSLSNLSGSSKKSLSVKRRPDKFASRMGFLVNDIEINPRKLSKPVSKVPGIVRQNSSSLTGKQNNLANNIHNSGAYHESSASIVTQSTATVTQSSAAIITQNSASIVTQSSATVTQSSAAIITQSSAAIITQSSASAITQNSASIFTPRSASIFTPRSASIVIPTYASAVTPRHASAVFHASAPISVQNSVVSINALKKPIDSLQIGNENDIIKPRDPRQNRVAHSSKQPETTFASTSKISDKRNFNFKSSNSNNQSPDHFNNNYPNNLMMNSLRFSVIKNLLKLQTGWLQEQKNKKVPPPSVYEGADYLELRYKSYESYVSSFCPMLMLELWDQMYVDSKEIIDSRKQYKKFYFSILSYTSRDDCIELRCESVVNDKVSFCPREGNIVILELKENAHRCSPAFGYIFHHKVQTLDLKNLKNSHWKNLPKESGWLTNAKHYTFLVYVKRRDKPLALDDLMKGNGLSYIGNKLRLLDAMSYMKNSPLMKDFLAPKWNTFLVNYYKCSPSMEYNTCQTEVINGVSAEINKSSETSKIILLQGPPGTGKTHTIIGLLQRLIHDKKFNQNFKVLVTAPSNAAIDEIGCRLIEVNKKYSSPRIKFVRIGAVDQVNPKMKPYFIDKKARELFESDSNSAYIQKNDELQRLRMDIDNLRKQPYSMHRNERIQHLEHRYKLCYDSISSKNMDYHTEMDYKTKILKESHIILSTLSSCGLAILLKTFKPNSSINFSCCIVDECTQCTELEILQPLVLGINKLILVGDHKQLPATVTSKLACKYGFEKSAFERFHLFFEKYFKKTPMYTLSEQFRMHSAICEFPSRYIYDKKIVTHPNTDLKYKSFPFHPYFLLDIPGQESDDSSSKINCTEASVIVHICTILIDIVDSSSIGIITPYQAQRSLYISALNVNPRYQDIEVNTVDGFQGREKDIIILSSVRANSQSGSIGFLACKRRLNVAITRARKCLIICAHADSLMNNMDWRELIFDAKRRNLCVGVPSPKDIPMIFKYNLKKDRSNLC